MINHNHCGVSLLYLSLFLNWHLLLRPYYLGDISSSDTVDTETSVTEVFEDANFEVTADIKALFTALHDDQSTAVT